MKVLVVGAGFSGAVVARILAEAGHAITLIESRSHIGGNCYTERDAETGVMLHFYGPHIFHTDDAEVWNYVNRFAPFKPYRHRTKTTSGGHVYSIPINLHTINQFYGKSLDPAEGRDFIDSIADHTITEPKNFEEQALRFIGRDLYEAFFKGYTEKQWGCSPQDLPASILKRLPLRFDYNDEYFNHGFQGIPENGYTSVFEGMLNHPNITLRLDTLYCNDMASGYDHLFWTGTLDGFFNYRLGRLGYRTLDFEKFVETGDFQGCPIMNYGDAETAFTRITEHKHFAPWETHDQTVCYREYSRACGPEDIPYYPIRLVEEKALLADYVELAKETTGVTFLGRLGTYRYLDMDVTIREAMDTAATFLENAKAGRPMPSFTREIL